jgi:hypothetical protein
MLTVLANDSSINVAINPPCTIPSCPHSPLPTCKNTKDSLSSFFALINGLKASFPGPRNAPAVRWFTRLGSGYCVYGRVSYQSSAPGRERSSRSKGRESSSFSRAAVYTIDSGVFGSGGGGAGRGERYVAIWGGYRAPTVKAVPKEVVKMRPRRRGDNVQG